MHLKIPIHIIDPDDFYKRLGLAELIPFIKEIIILYRFQDMGHLEDIEKKKEQFPKAEVQNSLKQEVGN